MQNFLLLITAVLFACSSDTGPPLMATDIDVRAPMPGVSMSAAYLTLTNNSDEPIRITAISSPQYGLIEIHETTIENEIARMRRIDELVIMPKESIAMQRGGIHLMMKQPAAEIRTVTLNLYDGEHLLMSLQTPITTPET